MAEATALPAIAVLLPEGWARLRFDDTIDEQIADITRFVTMGVEPQRRDLARIQLRRLLSEAATQARGSAYELWLPIAPTGGVTIPVTVTVAPMPSPLDPARTVADHLAAFAASAADSQFVEVGGLPAVRVLSDIAGERNEAQEWTAMPRRRSVTIVSPRRGGEWLVFFAEIIVPQEGADEIVAACEFFVDAFLKTVRFPPAPVSVTAHDRGQA